LASESQLKYLKYLGWDPHSIGPGHAMTSKEASEAIRKLKGGR
jgi:hypothetical protein